MDRAHRFRTPFAFAMALVSALLMIAAPTAASPAGPILSAATVAAPGAIDVTGDGFTPGGRVYVALYDIRGTRLNETRWTAASPTVYGRDGSQDPAAGFAPGGALAERFANLCGATPLVRAYDEATERRSNWLDVDTTEFGPAHFADNGSADPARGYVVAC
jgi:hypothetical protein